jgi:hypothetical protein
VEAILDEEVGDLLKSGSWISNFMAATDNLPFCIAIASANKNRHGFPLIFVNKMFIKTTGIDTISVYTTTACKSRTGLNLNSCPIKSIR